jgi:hypothetical protein
MGSSAVSASAQRPFTSPYLRTSGPGICVLADSRPPRETADFIEQQKAASVSVRLPLYAYSVTTRMDTNPQSGILATLRLR